MRKEHWPLLALVFLVPALSSCETDKKRTTDNPGQVITVRCDRGESLAARMDKAEPGTTVLVQGTCKETRTVNIDDDFITLRGGSVIGDPKKTGISITGKGVIVKDLTVTNAKIGLAVRQGGIAQFINVTAKKNTEHGVLVQGEPTTAKGRMQISTHQDNGATLGYQPSRLVIDSQQRARKHSSLLATIGAATFFRAAVAASDGAMVDTSRLETCNGDYSHNSGNGLEASIAAVMILCDDNRFDHNGHDGISARNASAVNADQAVLFGNHNGDAGIHLDDSSLTASQTTAEFRNNSTGVELANGAFVQVMAGTFDSVPNDIGLAVDRSSVVLANNAVWDSKGNTTTDVLTDTSLVYCFHGSKLERNTEGGSGTLICP